MSICRYLDSNKRKEVSQLEKEMGEIRFIETEDGFRIEAKGKKLKEALSCCCIPLVGSAKGVRVECCSPEEEKKD
jgi:hypothetical protein